MRGMKASRLPPRFHGELEEFFSSVKLDFAISGKTSLFAIYSRLQKAKAKKISAKRMRDAERMIRALCAAAEIRELRHGRLEQNTGMAASSSHVRRTMRDEIAEAGPASAPREILEQRKRVADAAAKAGILPPDLDYRTTDLRGMAKRLGLEK
jgi:hypothetical protein